MTNDREKRKSRPDRYTPTTARNPHPGYKIDLDKAAEALYEARGILAHAADMLGCTRRALSDLCNKHEKLREALEDARERRIDEVERAAYQRARDLSCPNVQKFILSTLGHKRGYVPPQQTSNQNSLTNLQKALDWMSESFG